MSDVAVEGKKVAKLMLVEINDDEAVAKGAAKQSNKFYNMYEQDDDTFIVEFGRVDVTCMQKTYDMSKWDSTIKAKTRASKGYKDVTHLFSEEHTSNTSSTSTVSSIADSIVKKLMDQLQSYANHSIQQNYTVSAKSVTQAMIDEAQETIDGLAGLISICATGDAVNKELLHLYHIIPRKMGDVRSHLLSSESSLNDRDLADEAKKILADEQDTLDVMAGQVSINDDKDDIKDDKPKDLLSILGIKVEKGDSSEVAMIKALMGPNANQFKACYKVQNNNTQKKFDKKLKSSDNKSTKMFFHGSRNQNWLNIISTGLMIRPSCAQSTGSMFGDGIYFADKAQKSIGYTSLRGSYWSNGSDSKAYLALFEVHTGEQKHIRRHDSSCYRLSKRVLDSEGTDSVFAHGGMDLRNNEYIVYDGNQCTISYLVEIG